MIHDYEPDDELLARLGGVLARVDPVPSSVIAAARASGTWRSVDAELASLTYDSVLDRSGGIGVRGGGTRLLTFTVADLTVDLEILDRGRGLIGQVSGAKDPRVEICHSDSAVPIATDRIGHFACPSIRPGPMSLRITDGTTGSVTQTEWVVV